MAEPLCLSGGTEKKPHWWLTNRMIAGKYLKDSKVLIATQEPAAMASALNLLDAALLFYPRLELAAELKARTLLFLRRFKDVAKMLREHIPSLNRISLDETASSCSSSSDSSSSDGSFRRERLKLLSSSSSAGDRPPAFKCFSVSDLKKKIVGGLCKSCQKDALWRYFVLGQACYHLGLMEDAVALLLTGKRIASDALRRESVCRSDDSFSFAEFSVSGDFSNQPPTAPKTESERTSQLLGHIKQLLRRKTSAVAAMDAGLYPEAIRHFTKIVDGRRAAPRGFLAECYALRASAFQSAGRIADAISDCNRTLALEPSSIEALRTRASLFETIRCLPDSLHDLEHLKLLYNTMLRDRTLPGPAWKRQTVQCREIPGKLCSLAAKIQELKQRVASGETGNADYYGLMGLMRGCSRTVLERAHLLLNLRHKPEKAASFVERVEFSDEEEVDSAGDRAKMTSLCLYRMIQRAYFNLTKILIQEEEELAAAAAERQRRELESEETAARIDQAPPQPPAAAVYQGVFCRDIAIVGSLLAQSGFGRRPIPVTYEALSC
ncbi:hypothetical protein DM860_011846 [Cuscuta australis]|uniref:J domain-containing protein n=1 Tax=Cuscuta australis TaxID=267555 RepID=A0A328DDS3_9ASTE|nr:hypothetical protein DM860_011846 [Cuscuta australis]